MIKRRKYDFVMGVGTVCSCSQSLRAAGLQLTSLPFDWLGTPSVSCARMLMETDFADWLRREDFELIPEEQEGRKNVWFNRRIQCIFAHDFKTSEIAEEIPSVDAKYSRRIERMKKLIGSSRRVLVVWVQVAIFPEPPLADFVAFRTWAETRWPGVRFDMLFFRWKKDLPIACAEDSEVDGVRTVAFDYQDRRQERWFADYKVLGAWLKRRYAVRDYRTAEEKRQWKRQVREKKFAKFGVRSWPAYFFARSAYALRKHFTRNQGGEMA